MTRLFAAAAVLATTLTLTGSAAAQPVGRSSVLPSPRSLSRFGLELGWWNQAVLDTHRDTIVHLVADEEVVFAQSSAGTVTAFDGTTGLKLWALQLGRQDSPSFPVTSNDELALVISGIRVYAIDKWSGDLRWQIRLPGQPSSSPSMDDFRLYVGMLDGSVYAVNLDKVRKLYNEGRLPEWSYQAVDWRYKSGAEVAAPPIPFRSNLFFASKDKSLYAITAEERSLIFQLETDAPISAPLGRGNGLIYLASEDYNIYAVNELSGQIRWRFVTGLPIKKAPVVIGENLFIAPQRGGVFELAGDTGARLRYWPRMTGFVGTTEKHLFLTDRVGDVAVVDKGTGAVLGMLPLGGFPVQFVNDRTDRLIVATESGLVLSIREQGKEFPTFLKTPEQQPILPELAPDAAP
jgi:outer membrane protein assembly factor BamB